MKCFLHKSVSVCTILLVLANKRDMNSSNCVASGNISTFWNMNQMKCVLTSLIWSIVNVQNHKRRSQRETVSVWVNSSWGKNSAFSNFSKHNATSTTKSHTQGDYSTGTGWVEYTKDVYGTSTHTVISPLLAIAKQTAGCFFLESRDGVFECVYVVCVCRRAVSGILLPCCSALIHYGSGLEAIYSLEHFTLTTLASLIL